MFTSSHGRSAGAGRASAATSAATSSTSPGSGHNRRMAANLPVAGWWRWSTTRPPHHHIAHPHAEPHRSNRAGWLRAAVLGANDGVVSTACLIVGVAGAGASYAGVRTAGIAGLAAGALSMALGEYVSVASQRDIEQADLRIERQALEEHPVAELRELAQIWEARGVEPELADGGGPPAHRQGRPRGPRPRRARPHRGDRGPARCRRRWRRWCPSPSARSCRWSPSSLAPTTAAPRS